nr:MAG TPA: hypothetical protein [Caudoviricetes sp.]
MNYWELQVRLIDNNYDTVLDKTYCNVGDTTTFQSVAQPELSKVLLWAIKICLIAGNPKRVISSECI